MSHLISYVQDAYFALTGACCASQPSIKLNGRKFTVLKLLGDLTEDSTSGTLFALKKLRCPGTEQLRQVMQEIEATKRFKHKNCIRCLDSCVTQEPDGSKTVYLFLPYYKRGNLQDAISRHAVNSTRFPEKEMLQLFLGTCEAVRAMHAYIPGPSATYPPNRAASPSMQSASSSKFALEDDDEGLVGHNEESNLIKESEHTGAELEDDEGSHFVQGKLDPHPRPNANASNTPKEGEMQPWAHRDLKPANVMISDQGQPILMDFGSAIPARIPVTSRSAALREQDRAAEHSTMPYRAPELFDVKTDTVLDEKVDVWSLGCTLFALAYGNSPFEDKQTEQGGSIALAVMNGSYKFPADDQVYSEGLRQLISSMLVVEPSKRPDIHAVIKDTKACLSRLT